MYSRVKSYGPLSLMWPWEQHRRKIPTGASLGLTGKNRTGNKNRTGSVVGCDWVIRETRQWFGILIHSPIGPDEVMHACNQYRPTPIALVQACTANALELLQSCTKLSTLSQPTHGIHPLVGFRGRVMGWNPVFVVQCLTEVLHLCLLLWERYRVV